MAAQGFKGKSFARAFDRVEGGREGDEVGGGLQGSDGRQECRLANGCSISEDEIGDKWGAVYVAHLRLGEGNSKGVLLPNKKPTDERSAPLHFTQLRSRTTASTDAHWCF